MQINMNEEQVDQCLFDALYAMMQTRTIDEMTVGEILERAHVSRSSFYRHYRDKYELLTKSYERILQNTYLQCLEGKAWKEAATSLYRVLAEHPKFFKHALASTGPNSLRQYICDISLVCHEKILRRSGVDLYADWRLLLAARCYVYGACEVTCQWAASGMPYDAEELIKLFYEIMPECLKRYCDV